MPRPRSLLVLLAAASLLTGCGLLRPPLSVSPTAAVVDLGRGGTAAFELRNDARVGIRWRFDGSELAALPASGTLAAGEARTVAITVPATAAGGRAYAGAFVAGVTRLPIAVRVDCDVDAVWPTASGTDGRVLVGYRPAVATSAARTAASVAAAGLALAAGGELLRVGALGEHDLLRVAPAAVDELVAALAARPEVAWASPDVRVERLSTPNDPRFPLQWNLLGFGAEAAWAVADATPAPATPVVVAVVDDGIAVDHPDLVASALPGWDAFHGDDDVRNCSDHGTHVAGIAVAARDDATGVAGVASQPWVRLLPVKAWPDTWTGEGGTLDAVLRGMRWAGGLPVTGAPDNPHAADVVNLSLGTTSTAEGVRLAFEDAIAALREAGVTVVAAAGNAGSGAGVQYPARAGALAVGSVDADGRRSSFSNYGAGLSLMAPGGTGPEEPRCSPSSRAIPSTGLRSGGGLAFDWTCKSGTSMASPYVAGAAALLLGVRPELRGDPQAVADALAAAAARWRPEDDAEGYGAGILCLDALLTTDSVCGVPVAH